MGDFGKKKKINKNKGPEGWRNEICLIQQNCNKDDDPAR